MKSTATLFVFLFANLALAAGGGHGAHDNNYIPVEGILAQVANLSILLAIIYFFIQKSAVDVFVQRKKNFLDQAEKTQAALKDAEAALADIKSRLQNLESGEAQSIENAKREAEVQKTASIKDAQHAVEKMKKEAQLVIGNELAKAKSEINSAIMSQALKGAQQKITQNQSAATQTQEVQFLKQLEEVRA